MSIGEDETVLLWELKQEVPEVADVAAAVAGSIYTFSDADGAVVTLPDSGGGGLVSTAMDYMIFAEGLRNGGMYNGQRILSSKTIKFMTKNHFESVIKPFEGGDMNFLKKSNSDGFGWGIGFGLVTESTKKGIIGSDGEYYW